MMITHVETARTNRPIQPLRTAAVVGRYAHHDVPEVMLPGRAFDVVFVESTAHAYSRIKRVLPDLVILCVSSDDTAGCQLLSMLALDSDTARIPVMTYFSPAIDGFGDEELGAEPDVFSYPNSMSVN